MSQRPSIRRADLRLRAEFPHLSTEVYELDPYQHLIYVPSNQLNAVDFAKEFNDRYRIIGDRVSITNERPTGATRVTSIADEEIGLEIEGLAFTRADIETVLAGKFPELPSIVAIRDSHDSRLRISFETAL